MQLSQLQFKCEHIEYLADSNQITMHLLDLMVAADHRKRVASLVQASQCENFRTSQKFNPYEQYIERRVFETISECQACKPEKISELTHLTHEQVQTALNSLLLSKQVGLLDEQYILI